MKRGTSSKLPYPGVSTKITLRSKTSPVDSLRGRLGRLPALESRSVSVFHQDGYARVLALISRMFSVGGVAFGWSVERRDKDGLINDEEDEEDNEGAV